MELARDLQQELGVRLTCAALDQFLRAQQQAQPSLEQLPRKAQLERLTAFLLMLDLNVHGDGGLPPGIKVSAGDMCTRLKFSARFKFM